MEAGDGNRTHVSSLEGWCSTIELHPRIYKAFGSMGASCVNAQNRNRTSDTRIFSPLLYLLSYLGLYCEILVAVNTTEVRFTTWLILYGIYVFVKYYFEIFIVFLFVQFY